MNWPEVTLIAVGFICITIVICTILFIKAFDRISKEEREAISDPFRRKEWKGTVLPPRRRSDG